MVDDVVDIDALDARLARQLSDAARLCGDAGEAQVMCDQVRRRLESVAAALRVTRARPASTDATTAVADDALVALADVVRGFWAFLVRSARREVVYRLASSRVVVAKVRGFHEALERLLHAHAALLASEAQGDVHAWQDRFENARVNLWLALDELSRDRMALLRDLLDSQAQQDALTLVMYEYKRPAGTYAPAERQVVQNAFNTITRFSRAKAPVLPAWFLPFYDVEVEAEAARESAAVAVRRGTVGDTPVVVKFVRSGVSEELLAAFMKAVSTWFEASRASPHVVLLHGASHVGEVFYVVEDVDGSSSSLRAFVASEPQRLWGALHGAALGLEALHSHGVVHGRLAPSSIVVTGGGRAKLADTVLTSSGLLEPDEDESGAAQWSAPELLSSGDKHQTFASDVYALGLCILDAVVGGAKPSTSPFPPRPEVLATEEQWKLVQQMCAERADERPDVAEVVAQFGVFAVEEQAQREAAEAAAATEAAAREAAQKEEEEQRDAAAKPRASLSANHPEKLSRQQMKEARKREKEAQKQEKRARRLSKQGSDKHSCIVQ